MSTRLRKLTVTTTLAAALLAPPALSQEWLAWDLDENKTISEEEFDQALGKSGLLSQWDEDEDTLLSEDEYATGMGSIYDSDESSFGEYDQNDDDLFDEVELGDVLFSGFDADDSGDLDESELSAFES